MNDLISVIIPTYNHAHFLEKAIQSVINQTYTNWEIIVIDNHSKDNTDEVVNGFKDQRISLLKVNNNGIIAFSRNVGIREARGEWIAFLDSDDIWYPSKLTRCMEKIASGFDLVCHGEYWVKNDEGIRKERKIVYGPEKKASFEQLLFEGNCISTSATVVYRQYLDKVNGFDESPDMITAEDYHLWVKLAREGARIGFVTEILGEYILHAGNSSKTALRSLHAIQTVFEKEYAEINKHSLKIKIKGLRRRAIILYSGARGLQENKEFWKALPFFLKAILRWPFIPKFYAALLLNVLQRRGSIKNNFFTLGNKNVFNADASSGIVRYYRLGRHALLTAFNILQIKKGDIVLVPAFICRDLLASIHAVGAIPAFYELDEGLKPVNLPFIVGVRAVIAVNYFGFPQNLIPFREYCQTSGATLIEDNAHGFLSCDETGTLLGSRGNLGFFSIRKTFELPDGAMLMINDSKFIARLPTQLSPRKESLSLGLRIKSGLSWLQRKSGINFLMTGRYIARLIRYLRTGYSIMPLAPENEFEMPAVPAPHAYLFKVLPGIDQEREINRRRTLYYKMHKHFASLDIQPVFDSLPVGTSPYCYPFYAAKETAAKVVQIANGMGLDCTYWPDLPSTIEADAPFHYRSLLIINFLC